MSNFLFSFEPQSRHILFTFVFAFVLFIPSVRSLGHLLFEPSIGSTSPNFGNGPLEIWICAREFRLFQAPRVLSEGRNLDNSDCMYGNGSAKFNAESGLIRAADGFFWVKSEPIILRFRHSWTESFSFMIRVVTPNHEVVFEESQQVFHQTPDGTWGELRRNLTATTRKNVQRLLKLFYRVDCDDNFFGPNCDVYCELSEWERQNHFECSRRNGVKRCQAGWGGVLCNVSSLALVEKECDGECLNGGTCNRSTGKCVCLCEFAGNHCERCTSWGKRNRGFSKSPCPEGYGGQLCETDLIFCTRHRHNPCENGGKCQNSPNGGYTCECPAGYFGANCEKIVNSCEQNPCMNGGLCFSNPSSALGFRCQCAADHHGQFCQVRAKGCVDKPCQNGGTCTQFVTLFTADISPAESPSLRTAKTVQKRREENLYASKCLCPPDWVGFVCDVYRPRFCPPNACANGGSCFVDLNSPAGFGCVCATGFEGRTCSNEVNDCKMNPCQNGGSCIDELSSFRCICSQGFDGELCQQGLIAPTNLTAPHFAQHHEKYEGSRGNNATPAAFFYLLGLLTFVSVILLVYIAVHIKRADRRTRKLADSKQHFSTSTSSAAFQQKLPCASLSRLPSLPPLPPPQKSLCVERLCEDAYDEEARYVSEPTSNHKYDAAVSRHKASNVLKHAPKSCGSSFQLNTICSGRSDPGNFYEDYHTSSSAVDNHHDEAFCSRIRAERRHVVETSRTTINADGAGIYEQIC